MKQDEEGGWNKEIKKGDGGEEGRGKKMRENKAI